MKDLRGVDRGACNNCGECDDFIGKVRCDYCDCAAAKHVNLSKTNFCENSSPAKRLKLSSEEGEESEPTSINLGKNNPQPINYNLIT